MSSLYGILSMADIAVKLPEYFIIAFSVILAIAFIVGLVKGVRKVAWGGFYWLVSGVGFIFANMYMKKMNPYTKLLTGKLATISDCLWVLTLALGCILVSLIIYGFFSAVLRPKEMYTKGKKSVSSDEYDFELEDDEEDDTESAEETTIVIKGGGKPKFFGRLGGAFMCLINTAAVLAAFTALFLFIVDFTPLKNKEIGQMFTVSIAATALKYAKIYALDFFIIGIIFWFGYKGFQKGFLKIIHGITSTFGILAVVVICFIIPFNKIGNAGIFGELKDNVAPLFAKFKDPFEGIFLNLTTGALLAVVSSIALVILNFILKGLIKAIKSIAFFRTIDGFLSLIVYLALGAAIVVLILGALYLLDYCKIFNINDGLFNESILAKNFFDGAGDFLKDFAEKYLLKAKA